jgi:hypothetical protein
MDTKLKRIKNIMATNPNYGKRIIDLAYEMTYEPELLVMAEMAKKHAETRGTVFYTQIIKYIRRFI